MSNYLTVRRRGRPCGTGKDDSDALRHVATLLLDGKEKTGWAAINRTVSTDPAMMQKMNVQRSSIVRRLHRKWRVENEKFLAEVRAENARQREEQFLRGTKDCLEGAALFGDHLRTAMMTIHEQMRLIHEQLGPTIREVHEAMAFFVKRPEMKAALETWAAIKIDPRLIESVARIPHVELNPALTTAFRNAQALRTGCHVISSNESR